MQKGLKLDGQMRGLALSLGGGAAMAIVAMLIPVTVFESITGSTGISELVPATAAPLGDTARAMIAFLFAAGAFAGLAAIFLRQPVRREAMRPAPVAVADRVLTEPSQPKPSAFDQIRKTVADWVASRRAGPVVTELSDLPKLRAGDAHPDAPPRRPISAHRDFGEIEDAPVMPISPAQDTEVSALVETPLPIVLEPQPQPEPEPQPQPDAVAVSVQPASKAPAVAIAEAFPDERSVTALVDQLEAAVARRQMQVQRLETLAVSQQAIPVSQLANPTSGSEETATEDTIAMPALEVVPSVAQETANGEEMDEALRSALETLQRMNARSR